MKDKIKESILNTPFNHMQGNYHTTGWIGFKKENLHILKSLVSEIEGFRVDETLLRWSRIKEMSDKCQNKIKTT
jgi:hypothetical protein